MNYQISHLTHANPVLHRPVPIMHREQIAVESQGENVVVHIGNTPLTMHYETALKVSAMIRLAAHEVKKRVLPGARISRSLGTLHDASAKKLRSQPRERIAAPNVIGRPSMTELDRVKVTDEGQSVLLTVGNHTLTMYWGDAITIAQWIRLRGKESRNRAGDARHWSKLATLET